MRSERHANSQLKVSRLHHGAGIDIAQTPERRVVGRRRQVADAKQRVVLGVQRFDAHLHPDAVVESKILRQAQIHQVMRLESHMRERRREHADVGRSEPDLRGLERDDLPGRVAERLAIEGVEAAVSKTGTSTP